MQKCKGIDMKIITARQKQYTNSKKMQTNIEEISKGFSPDKKYIITNANNEKYLFRTGDIKEYERKKIEFQILNEMVKRNVQAQRPIEIGILEEEGVCYSIFHI